MASGAVENTKKKGGQMSVEAILKTKGHNIFTIRPEHSVSEAAALMASKRVGVAIVCDAKGRLMGVVSERDIVSGITQYGKGLLEMPVRNIMTSPVVTCAPNDSIKKVMEVMTERRIRHLPVLEGEELVGMISIGDAVNFRLHEAQMETAVLRDFAATR
ncbi:putative signal transduction protein with CBS domains [Magnetospirillum sp. LM-5]|nr:putative signal transduction protein with CBS domains [Magnetospirillum sp. LM-5]